MFNNTIIHQKTEEANRSDIQTALKLICEAASVAELIKKLSGYEQSLRIKEILEDYFEMEGRFDFLNGYFEGTCGTDEMLGNFQYFIEDVTRLYKEIERISKQRHNNNQIL